MSSNQPSSRAVSADRLFSPVSEECRQCHSCNKFLSSCVSLENVPIAQHEAKKNINVKKCKQERERERERASERERERVNECENGNENGTQNGNENGNVNGRERKKERERD